MPNDRLLEGRTSFVIAHRLSTIQHAGQVLMLKAGQIVERGTHQELLANRGPYYELYMSQFRGEEESIGRAERVASSSVLLVVTASAINSTA